MSRPVSYSPSSTWSSASGPDATSSWYLQLLCEVQGGCVRNKMKQVKMHDIKQRQQQQQQQQQQQHFLFSCSAVRASSFESCVSTCIRWPSTWYARKRSDSMRRYLGSRYSWRSK